MLNYESFPNLSPLSLTENRNCKKSITPYPIWNTDEAYRNKKEDSLLLTDYEDDKENVINGHNVRLDSNNLGEFSKNESRKMKLFGM